MGIFNQILDAVNSPERQASWGQVGTIVDTVQQLSNNYQTNPDNVQSALSIVGNYTRSALQQQRLKGGESQAQQIVNQYGGVSRNSQVVQALFNMPQIEQMVMEIEKRTGLRGDTIQGMLPVLVPLVLNFLKTGNHSQNSLGSNPVLNQFLDADGDGDVDMADAIKMAMGHLNR